MSQSLLLILVVCLAALSVYLWMATKKLKNQMGPNIPMSEESLKDPVTRLFNRGYLTQRLKEWMARADRDKRPFALILWDINGFISFNNEFGHEEGDRLLHQVADAVRRSLRLYDEAFRSGPDEFCAILTPADKDIAQDVAKRVSEIVMRDLFQGDSSYPEGKFSLSYGFVFYPDDGVLPEALLHAARQALYKNRTAQVPVPTETAST